MLRRETAPRRLLCDLCLQTSMSARSLAFSTTRDALVVAAVAVLTVQALRRWCGDRYVVPSGSMQPLLYGDPDRGDVVFVDKLTSASARARGDLVVVENPSSPGHQLVKRIVASGDDPECWVDILRGDVWLGENRQQLRREVKEPRAAMAQSVTWASSAAGRAASPLDLRAAPAGAAQTRSLPPMARALGDARAALSAAARIARHRELDDGVLPVGVIGTASPVDACYVDVEGRRSVGGEDVFVADCGAQLSLGDPPEALLMSLETGDFAVTFVWEVARGALQVWMDGQAVVEERQVAVDAWTGEVAFGRLDGRDFVLLGLEEEVVLETPGEARTSRPKTWLHVGVVGDRAVEVRGVRVFRDIYYYREPVQSVGPDKVWPKFVRPGHWFLLGDNGFDSRDSRQIGDVPTSSFMGVPARVIGPWGRARALER